MRYILRRMEISMGLALRKENMDTLLALPPEPDWGAILRSLDSVKAFQRLVAIHERELVAWQQHMKSRLSEDLDAIRQQLSEVPADVAADALLPAIDGGLRELERSIAWYAIPVEQSPEFAPVIQKTRQLSGGAAKFFRKQIKRIGEMKSGQLRALLDVRANILAFRQEVEDDFAFEAHVADSMNRYPVVNAVLAR